MARLPLTSEDCRGILGAKKRISENVVWVQKANKAWATARVDVELNSEIKGRLELILTVNAEEPSKWSFSLILNAAHRISGLDYRGSHENKCSDGQRWIRQTHKHTWSDTCPGGHAYTPTDITSNSLEDTFREFCRESNIDFQGAFRALALQPSLRGAS